MARRYTIGLGVIWLLVVIISVAAPLMTPVEGDGFTRGLNRVMEFFLFQFVAVFIAIAALYAALRVEPPRSLLVKVAGFIPAIVSALLVLALVVLILMAQFNKPSPDAGLPPGNPTTIVPTEPVDPGN
jgi:hypothetical protein